MYEHLITTQADWVFPDLQFIGHQGFAGMAGEYSVLEQILRNYVDTGSLVARRVYDSGVRFDPAFKLGFIDWDFWLQATSNGFRGAYVPGAGFLYRRRPESLVRNAGRDRSEIVGHIRRKYSKWITPRHCTELEHDESPRYALLVLETAEVELFTDPSARSRVISREKFVRRTAWLASRHQLGRSPAYLIASSRANIELLERAKLLHGLLWHLERSALHFGSPVVATYDGADDIAIRTVGAAAVPGLIGLARLDALATPSQGNTPSTVTTRLKTLSMPKVPLAAVSEALGCLMADIRSAFANDAPSPVLLVNTNHRTHTPVAPLIATYFDMGPLLPLADKGPRICILSRASDLDALIVDLESDLMNAKAAGWSVHVVWIQPRSINGSLERGHCIDSLVPVSSDDCSDATTREAARLLAGLLSGMTLVLNCGCSEWLFLSGQIKRYGIHTVFWDCAYDKSSRDPLSWHKGLQYEHALSAYLVRDASARTALKALGVPSAKVQQSLSNCLHLLHSCQ
jgi:hypothetical protein